MSALRTIKRQARRDLHDQMEIPAYYLRQAGAAPMLVHVRLWYAANRIGQVKGSRIYPAEMENESDRLRFDLSEIGRTLENGAIVSLEAGEAYRIDNLLPPDDEFQTAEVSRMTGAETDGLPVPDPDA
jgi:hypothetical protein